jgi:hypothetical protein
LATVLRKREMNALLDVIKRANMDPRQFARRDLDLPEFVIDRYSRHFHRLELGNTGVTFTIATEWQDGVRHYSWRGARCTITNQGPSSGGLLDWSKWNADFVNVENAFEKWLESEAKKYFQYLADEEEDQATPDRWAELDMVSADLSVLQNTPFTDDERTRIEDVLQNYLKDVENRAILSQDAFRLLRERVEYSIDASKRLSRKDWINATTGALIGYAFQVGLTASVANELLQLAADALSWIWTMQPPLLLP